MFESLKWRYQIGWVRLDQLKRYHQLGAITKEEYKLISGFDYAA